MNNVDVLLVLPPMYQTGRTPDHNPKEPMGLMYIASYLRKAGITVEIMDADILAMTVRQTIHAVSKSCARIIGFSVMQRALPSFREIARGIRQRGCGAHICCGGFAATLSAEHILRRVPEVDSVVLGEGEEIFARLASNVLAGEEWRGIPGVAYMDGECYVIPKTAEKPQIDSLAWPSRDILPICFDKTNYATLVASRGCYGNCTFCSNKTFERASAGPKWRGRDAVDIADEICHLREVYGVSVFKLNDPNMFGPGSGGREHVSRMCREIISRGISDIHMMGFCRSNDIDEDIAFLMRRAGFERILIGIESSSPYALKEFRKGETIDVIRKSMTILRRAEISIVPGFMIFNPYTTLDSLEDDLGFLEESGLRPILAKSLRIFDGTPIQHMMAAEGRLVERDPFEGYHEYTVDRDVAAAYMALKTVSVDWVGRLKKSYQDSLWRIKKAPSFAARKKFDSLNKQMFLIERDMLMKAISWIRGGFRTQDMSAYFGRVLGQLDGIERFIRSEDRLADARKPVLAGSSAADMSERIACIIAGRKYETFPEKYRWHDD